jgi:hypothetical protein
MHPEKFSDHAELHNWSVTASNICGKVRRHSRGASAPYRPSSSRFARLAPTGGCVRFSCSLRTSWSLNGFGISPAGTGLQQNALACGPRTRLGLLSQVLLAFGRASLLNRSVPHIVTRSISSPRSGTGAKQAVSVLRVPMRHEFHTQGHLDPDQVRSGLTGLSNKHCQSGRRRERLPVDVFRQNRSENGFARLVISNRGPPSISHHLAVLDRFKNTWANTARYGRNLSSVIGRSRTRFPVAW